MMTPWQISDFFSRRPGGGLLGAIPTPFYFLSNISQKLIKSTNYDYKYYNTYAFAMES